MSNIDHLLDRSLCWGTLVPKDLFHAFIRVCALLDIKLDEKFYGDLDPFAEDYSDEEWSDLWEQMCIHLEYNAPEGYYFGTSEGDGSDFGFWEFPEEPPEEPMSEDYIIKDCGPLLSQSCADVAEGEHIGVYSCHAEAIDACKRDRERNGIYTDIWIMSDHGNWTRVTK